MGDAILTNNKTGRYNSGTKDKSGEPEKDVGSQSKTKIGKR